MSEIAKVIEIASERFNSIVEAGTSGLIYDAEKGFAIQLLNNNSYLMKAAIESPASLQAAICNVAAIQLSLNPAEKLAYLIPRNIKIKENGQDKYITKIFLEPSYMGLIRLATNSGSVEWVQASLVYENDTYENNGVGNRPTHSFKSFGADRGKVVGVYCIAKTLSGDFLTTEMTLEEINGIMERSESIKTARKKDWKLSGPWITDWNEQAKKTVIRRGFKTWPRSNKNKTMDEAIHMSNENEGFEPIINNPNLGDFTAKTKEYFDQLITNDDALEMYVLQQTVTEREFTNLYHSFEKGTKGKYQAVVDELTRKGLDEFNYQLQQFQEGFDLSEEGMTQSCMDLIKERAE